jgi:hypothetical protein
MPLLRPAAVFRYINFRAAPALPADQAAIIAKINELIQALRR